MAVPVYSLTHGDWQPPSYCFDERLQLKFRPTFKPKNCTSVGEESKHARQQTLAILDSTIGEAEEKILTREGGNVREFYSGFHVQCA
jgi:hypothetical protein